MSDPGEVGNPHVPSSTESSLARHLNPADLLPLIFFNQALPHSSQWSVIAFQAWLETVNPHLDPVSHTAYGGPLGARVLVFACSVIFQSISRVTGSSRIPEDIRRVVRGDQRTWSSSNNLQKLRQCVSYILRDIVRTTSVLSITLAERAAAWEDEIHLRYNTWCKQGKPIWVSTGNVEASTTTSGVPLDHAEVERIWNRLQERDATVEELDESMEASRVIARRSGAARRAPLRVPSDSEDEGSNSGREIQVLIFG